MKTSILSGKVTQLLLLLLFSYFFLQFNVFFLIIRYVHKDRRNRGLKEFPKNLLAQQGSRTTRSMTKTASEAFASPKGINLS